MSILQKLSNESLVSAVDADLVELAGSEYSGVDYCIESIQRDLEEFERGLSLATRLEEIATEHRVWSKESAAAVQQAFYIHQIALPVQVVEESFESSDSGFVKTLTEFLKKLWDKIRSAAHRLRHIFTKHVISQNNTIDKLIEAMSKVPSGTKIYDIKTISAHPAIDPSTTKDLVAKLVQHRQAVAAYSKDAKAVSERIMKADFSKYFSSDNKQFDYKSFAKDIKVEDLIQNIGPFGDKVGANVLEGGWSFHAAFDPLSRLVKVDDWTAGQILSQLKSLKQSQEELSKEIEGYMAGIVKFDEKEFVDRFKRSVQDLFKDMMDGKPLSFSDLVPKAHEVARHVGKLSNIMMTVTGHLSKRHDQTLNILAQMCRGFRISKSAAKKDGIETEDSLNVRMKNRHKRASESARAAGEAARAAGEAAGEAARAAAEEAARAAQQH